VFQQRQAARGELTGHPEVRERSAGRNQPQGLKYEAVGDKQDAFTCVHPGDPCQAFRGSAVQIMEGLSAGRCLEIGWRGPEPVMRLGPAFGNVSEAQSLPLPKIHLLQARKLADCEPTRLGDQLSGAHRSAAGAGVDGRQRLITQPSAKEAALFPAEIR
jgi:hypothetical protein